MKTLQLRFMSLVLVSIYDLMLHANIHGAKYKEIMELKRDIDKETNKG